MAWRLSAASGPQRARCRVFAQPGAPRGAGRGCATGGTRRWHRAASATAPCIPMQTCWMPSAQAGATCGLPGAGAEPPRSSRGLSSLCWPSWRAVCQEQTRRGRAVPARRRLVPDKPAARNCSWAASAAAGGHLPALRSHPAGPQPDVMGPAHAAGMWGPPGPALSRETQHADAFPWLYCAQ